MLFGGIDVGFLQQRRRFGLLRGGRLLMSGVLCCEPMERMHVPPRLLLGLIGTISSCLVVVIVRVRGMYVHQINMVFCLCFR